MPELAFEPPGNRLRQTACAAEDRGVTAGRTR